MISADTSRVTRPLSFNQSSHLALEWLAQLRSKGRPGFPMVLGLSLEGAPNVDAIQDALNEVIRRHEVLRASFLDPRRLSSAQEAELGMSLIRHGIADTGVFSQRIWPDVTLPLRLESTPADDPDAIPHDVRDRIRDEVARPFDYSTPPLMRATLFTLNPAYHILVVVLHHLVSDAWSVGVLRSELERLYNCRVSGRPFEEIPALPMQYSDFAERQREQFSKISPELVAYCQAQWATYGQAQIKPSDVPPAHGSSTPADLAPGYQYLTIDPVGVRDVRALAKQYRVTTYMLGLTAIAILFHAYTQRTVLAWWGYCSNRASEEAERLIGWVAHGRLFGVTVTPSEPVATLIAHVRDRVYDMYEHEEVPVQVWWRILREQQVAAHESLDDQYVSFDAFMEHGDDRVTLADGMVTHAAPRAIWKNGNWPSLGLWSFETPDAWTIDCRYSSTRCEPAAIASMLDDFGRVLVAIARTPEATVSHLVSSVLGR